MTTRFGNEKTADELFGRPTKFRVLKSRGHQEWVVQGLYDTGWDLVNAYTDKATADEHCRMLREGR